MDKYEIISENEETREEIEAIIERLNLKDNLSISDVPGNVSCCPLELACRIKKGETLPDHYPGGTLEIYISADNPNVVISEAKWVSFHSPTTINIFSKFLMEDVLIELYNENLPEQYVA